MKKFGPKNWNLRDRIIATVAYFDVFDHPISINDLKRLLIGDNTEDIEKQLFSCKPFVNVRKGYVYLNGREKIIEGAYENEGRAEKLIKIAEKKAWIIRLIPFVELAAICNYIPLGVSEENSDIDLFIVTKKERLFVVRVFLTVMTHVFGMRRHAKKIKGRYCLSFYSDERYLNFDGLLLSPSDVYFAYWTLALLPIYGDERVFNKIRTENNAWLNDYFEGTSGRWFEYRKKHNRSLVAKIFETLLIGWFGDFLENRLAKYFISRYEKRKQKLPKYSSVEVSKKRLKFHNYDKRAQFNAEFQKRLQRLGLSN